MILHLLYITAFTVLAVLAVTNMIRNLMTLGIDSQRSFTHDTRSTDRARRLAATRQSIPHPEFLDESGNIINEPLLVMRSMTVEDAREQLNALYEASPGSSNLSSESREES